MNAARHGWALTEVVGALIVLGLAAGALVAAALSLADCAQARRGASSEAAFSDASSAWLRFGGGDALDPARHPLRDAARGALAAPVPSAAIVSGGLELRAWTQPSAGRGAAARAWLCGPVHVDVATRLAAPRFRYSGVLPDSAFPLRDILLPHPDNPPGTVYRFTTDGTDPTAASPVWDPMTTYPLWPFPAELRAAAFASGSGLEPSVAAVTRLRRRTRARIERIDGSTSTAYTLAEALAPPSVRGLRIWIDAAPPGTALRVTLDGSDPASGSVVSGPVSVAPSAGVLWRPNLTVRARGVGPAQIEIEDAVLVLEPRRTPLPLPRLSPSGGSLPSPATVRVETDPLPVGAAVNASVNGGAWTPCSGTVIVPWQ